MHIVLTIAKSDMIIYVNAAAEDFCAYEALSGMRLTALSGITNSLDTLVAKRLSFLAAILDLNFTT